LLVLRDIIFVGARHFRELLASPERISSNILADRLAGLVEHGLLTKADGIDLARGRSCQRRPARALIFGGDAYCHR
jgi:hypothetical protein